MLNLRNVVLASALLLALAVGVALADPASDTVEASAEVLAEVANVRLFEPQYKWTPIPSGIHEPETLVEGHSVFVVLDAMGNRTPVEGEVTVTGLVQCEPTLRVGESGPLLTIGGYEVPYVTGIKEASVRCVVDGHVIVTPTVYCQVQGDWECDASVMVPTGMRYPLTAPDGQAGEVVEYAFTATPPGESEPRTFYAFEVPVLAPWLHEDDHLARNMWAPLPLARLDEMGAWDFKFLHADRVEKL